MFIEATIFLFAKIHMETLNWTGVALAVLLYSMAFFPKVIQRKYEKLNELQCKLDEIKKEKQAE
jgi:hypothetical protein